MLSQSIFDQTFLEAHGITDLDIHDPKYGWELDFKVHRGKGESLHSSGWNPDWKAWIKEEIKAGRRIDKCSIEKQLGVMKDKYAKFLDQGAPVKTRYKPVSYKNFKRGVGVGSCLILASILAGELTGENAAKAEEIQSSLESYISSDNEYEKMIQAATIAEGLSKLTGASSTIIVASFFKSDGTMR